MGRFRAAAVQMHVGSDKRANLERATELVRDAASRGAQLVALPELFFWGGPVAREVEEAEAIPGPTTAALSSLAAELGIHLVAGSILERVEGQEKVFNTCIFFDPGGQLSECYRKIHLFDVDIGDEVSVRESRYRAGGRDPVVAACELAPLGLAVCYDLRFPELFRQLVDAGAEVVCMPSAFTFATGSAHWETLVRARAIENQVYMIAPDQVGRGASGILNYGSSMIVDPWGVVLARAGDGDGVITAEIDLAYLRRARRELPCLDHRVLRA